MRPYQCNDLPILVEPSRRKAQNSLARKGADDEIERGWRSQFHVLKAKYFSSSSILEAKPKFGMSYSWQSVLRGIELVKKGMTQRVEDGLKLKIGSDPWIARDFS